MDALALKVTAALCLSITLLSK